jgi:Fe-S cluster assembly protein SufD
MVQAKENAATQDLAPQLEKFEWFEGHARQPAWVFPLRKAGMARFAELGYPTLRDEDWRFTNVAPIAKLPFRPALEAGTHEVTAADVADLVFGKIPARRLVFLNGHYAPHLSAPGPEQAGVVVTSLAAALARDAGLIERQLAAQGPGSNDAFSALNTAFFRDGAFIHLREGRALPEPIHLLFISTAKEPGTAIHPRNLIVAEKGSRLTVLESYVSVATASYFTNAVTELVVGEGAALEHCKFQDEASNAYHVAAIHARLGGGSNLVAHSLAAGARLARNNIRAALAGEGVECILNGLYLTRGEQLADHHMVVEHAQPHCRSHEYYNGILDGRSKGVFHGRILVRQAAQKTDAKQTNKNLLLSPDATIDTKPQLEIYADDVKCTHGATIGQLNDESIFYLRARGIGADTARRMLIHAFAGEIIERIRCAPAREELDKLVWDRLEQNPQVGEARPEPNPK